MKNVVIYTTQICPYRVQAKGLLDRKGVAYKEIRVDGNPQLREELIQKSGGKRTVPQIFIGGEFIGGATELFDACRDGRMGELLEKSSVEYDRKVNVDPYSFLPSWLHPR